MTARSTVVIALLGVLAAAASAAFVIRQDGTPPTVDDLVREIEQLQKEVKDLRAALPAGGTVSVLQNLDVPGAMTLCGQPVPLDRPEVREALAFELLLTAGRPTMPLLWMRRAPVVMPAIEDRLARRQLPADLKYLPMIESDMRWTAESPAGAGGLWQFIPATGRRYGLRADRTLDERMDPERATDAALLYLAELHREFGDWFLAFAAYNVGEAYVRQAIAEQGTRDYFQLWLPLETRRYVFRMLAAKLVYDTPERYGLFRMVPLYSPKYRTVEVTVGRGTSGDLREIARREKVSYFALRTHNPQVRGNQLPAGKNTLRIPE